MPGLDPASIPAGFADDEGCSLHVTIYLNPSDVDAWFKAFRPVYQGCISEKECTFFTVARYRGLSIGMSPSSLCKKTWKSPLVWATIGPPGVIAGRFISLRAGTEG
jgi:hypothetical protein